MHILKKFKDWKKPVFFICKNLFFIKLILIDIFLYIFYNKFMEKQNKLNKVDENLDTKFNQKKTEISKKPVINKTSKTVNKSNTKKVINKKKLNDSNKPEKGDKQTGEKVKKTHKPLSKKQIILISSISVAAVVLVLTIVLCLVFIKPKTPEITLSKIEVLRSPTKLSGYQAFEEFDDDGLVLKATYSDDSTRDVYEGWQVLYVSSDNITHTDGFYAGETKVRIDYYGKTCEIEIDEVLKVQRNVQISLERYSQIKIGNAVNLPIENVVIKNLVGEIITNLDFTLVYCKQFESLQNYQKTTADDGAIVVGGAPKNAGTYKVFAVINGGQNYFDKQSDAVELSIVDDETLELYAGSGEIKFGFKEHGIPAPINPTYIEFELDETGDFKTINYYSNFAGNGKAYIYETEIELISSENGKTQISLENNEISIKNSEKVLKKWLRPNYLGTYERTVTPEFVLDNYGLTLSENKKVTLEIFDDDTKKDGTIYFKFNLLWKNGEQLELKEMTGTVVFSKSQSGTGNLSFNIKSGELNTKLFGIDGINESDNLSTITINDLSLVEASVSSGEYTKI